MRQLSNLVLLTNDDFAEYYRNRMYPPGYRRESAMIKLTMQHVNAICHAELIMDTQVLSQMAARLRSKTEDHLLRLAELKLYIITAMAEPPKLPYEESSKESPNDGHPN